MAERGGLLTEKIELDQSGRVGNKIKKLAAFSATFFLRGGTKSFRPGCKKPCAATEALKSNMNVSSFTKTASNYTT